MDISLSSEGGAGPLTSNVTPTPPAAVSPPYRDRGTGLIVFGVLQIMLGCLALLFVPFILLSALMSRKMGGGIMPAGNYILSVATYGLAAAGMVTLGVGSIRARRWARALTLVLSWLWLVTGTLGTVLITAVLPTAFLTGFRAAAARTPDAQPMSTLVMAVVLTFMIALCAIFLIVLPILFVAFYRKSDVEETCRRRDPVERWTDRAPLPVLAASVVFASGAVYCVLLSFSMPILPVLGRYFTGVPAALLLLAIAVLDGFLAYALLRSNLAAWWIAVAALILRLGSAALTFHRADLFEAYAKMGWSQEQMRVLTSNPGIRSGVYLYWGLMFSVLFLGYLFWIKRYFKHSTPRGPVEAELPVT